MRHLAILSGSGVEKILSGDKKVEGRFTYRKIAPFGLIEKGDVVLFKKPGKRIYGQFRVDKVLAWDHPDKEDLEAILKKYDRELGLDQDFWYSKEKINYATLVFIGTVSPFLVSPKIEKKDRRGWVVLG